MGAERLKAIPGDGKREYWTDFDELKRLEHGYACEREENPRWCVYGNDHHGNRGVLHWIRPLRKGENAGEGDNLVSSEEFIARTMAKLITAMGGSARAEMTEWNGKLKGAPAYQRDDTPRR